MGAQDAAGSASRRYQILLVSLLCLNFGILFFDRNALNFLMPFIQPELGLSYTEVGLLGSALSLTWALAAIFVGWLSDKTGKRKILILVSTLIFSVCSVVSGLATGFLMLLGARLLMGLSEGGVMPISHAMVVHEVEPKHRGLAMGVTQNLGSSILGSSVAPLVLVPIALAYGWRNAFFIAAIPGVISALLIWLFVIERQLPPRPVPAPGARPPLLEVASERNVVVCALLAILLVAYLVVTWAFMPLVMVQLRGYSEGDAAWLMAVLGIASAVCGFLVPALSDRLGRRPVMVGFTLSGVILPLGALLFDGAFVAMAAIFFAGWAFNGIFPMFMATVPAESVDPARAATAMGIVMGVGEVLGGVLAPTIAGSLSDAYGLQAVCWLLVSLALGGTLVALALRETAPHVLARRSALSPA
ncbi:MFS transporter [Aurantiacibacter flavus]|uniref:MFS transporter n=1 Tax=Aurantiacibacter flavus TaxID=3145232 RepID=A0ABV0D188_9SPHN